jgi:hypothetical protein
MPFTYCSVDQERDGQEVLFVLSMFPGKLQKRTEKSFNIGKELLGWGLSGVEKPIVQDKTSRQNCCRTSLLAVILDRED